MVNAPLNSQALLRLHQALTFWQQAGYIFVNLPWLVSREYLERTKPAFVTADDIHTPYGGLVASGEQSFLQLWGAGCLPAGTGYIGWTPCFRNETRFDATHHFYFVKAELFVPAMHQSAETLLADMLTGAKRFFRELAQDADLPIMEEVIAESQIDLVLNGVEVGSYGIRPLTNNLAYVYGTALAEPRFSYALRERYRSP